MLNCWHWHPERVSMELCKMGCVDLTKSSVKILCIHFSYNKKIEDEENFIKLIKKLKMFLNLENKRFNSSRQNYHFENFSNFKSYPPCFSHECSTSYH